MRHDIPAETFGPHGSNMAHAVAACVHCGFCLPVCPTYKLMGEEMDSPRGRIILMKEVLEGNLALAEALPYVDRCLGCLGCVTACPSGVPFGELLVPFRLHAESRRRRSAASRLTRFTVRATLPHPARFRLAANLGRMTRSLHGLAPAAFQPLLSLLPGKLPQAQPLPEVFPAQGQRRARVALLSGCVQQVLDPDINWATLRVLARNGVEVIVPKGQGCCGALAMHTGDGAEAISLATQNLRAFPSDVDAVITNAAGCGSGLKEYALLLKGTASETTAVGMAQRSQDVSAFLDALGLSAPPPPLPQPTKVAYHDACHLAHAQGVRDAPRRLLQAVGNLTLVEIPEGDICCGSAGTYNIEQPELARALGERKAGNIAAAGADALATGNIGCLTQIRTHLAGMGKTLPLYHTIQILDRAYTGAGLR